MIIMNQVIANMRKNSGPRIDLCGTPYLDSLITSFKTIGWVLFCKYDTTNLRAPICFNFCNKSSWLMLSKCSWRINKQLLILQTRLFIICSLTSQNAVPYSYSLLVKPWWLGKKMLFTKKKENIWFLMQSSNICCLQIFSVYY